MHSSEITWDFTNLDESVLNAPTGLHRTDLESALPAARTAHLDLMSRRESGALPFYDLPFRGGMVAEVRAYAEEVRNHFRDVVVLGIGGSSLGAAALYNALGCTPSSASPPLQLHFPDNVDPFEFDRLLGSLNLEQTLFNVITKSGGTPETIAQYLIVRERLEHRLKDRFRDHLVFTTDPQKGLLRRLSREEGIRAFDIDPGVGGRFSVFTPVGLLPAALAGLDVDALCAGARAAVQTGTQEDPFSNPAYRFALSLCLLRDLRAVGTVILMPYCNRLLGLADWFRQLWAESLGKRYNLKGEEIFWGQTPEKALGATDQHSQVQLYMEGPFDKVICFLEVADHGVDVIIPRLYPNIPELDFWAGHTLGELINAECAATREALLQAGRPNLTALFSNVTAFSVGNFLMTLEIATVFAGAFLGINALDQPGVEWGKKLTKQKLAASGK